MSEIIIYPGGMFYWFIIIAIFIMILSFIMGIMMNLMENQRRVEESEIRRMMEETTRRK
jgi:hypothetical protein